MAIASVQGGYSRSSGMLMRNEGSSADSLVAMLGPCSSPVGLQARRNGGGSELDAVLQGGHGQKRPFFATYDGPTVEDGPEEGDEGADDCSPGGSQLEKKRRLTFEQVRSLEKNFEMENKLEPERKMQLAKELGLRPRQVAVWFQNRRARWKTKQLERDYETLAADYKRLKADYDQVLGEKNNLRAEIQRLSGDTPGDGKQDVTESAQPGSHSHSHSPSTTPRADTVASDFVARHHNVRASPTVDVSLLCAKEKEETSGSCTDGSHSTSDVLDADSPRTTDSSSQLSAMSEREQLIHSPDSFPPESSFMAPDMLPDVTRDAAVKLEDGLISGAFHDDHSCNYLLLQMDDQSGVLPWWDWP